MNTTITLAAIAGLLIPAFGAPTASELKSIGLSEQPSIEELKHRSVLSMPYFLEAGEPTSSETNELLAAVISYRKGSNSEDRYAPLSEFLEKNPGSSYRLWVEASLAKDLYQAGRYSDSLKAWEEAWNRTRGMFGNEPRKRAYVGQVGVELGGLYARLGRKQDLGLLLKSLDDMPLIGVYTEKRQRIREGYTQMSLHPERSFNCGPYAFANALEAAGEDSGAVKAVRDVPGTGDSGFTLAQLESLASKHGLDWQVGKLTEDGEPVFPCVVHWKADHYAAALKSNGGKVLLVDPTFEVRKWVPVKEILAESSGYYLIPGKSLPEGWEAASTSEKNQINGKGAPETKDDDDMPDTSCSKKKCSKGMPVYGYDDFFLGVVIEDTPLILESPFGPGLGVKITYRENSMMSMASLPFSQIGSKWSLNHQSVIVQDSVDTTKYRLYLPDGRQETHIHNGVDFDMQRMSNAQLVAITGGYKRISNDGSELIYAKLSDDGNRHYLTKISDPQGNSLDFTYVSGPSSVGDRIHYVEDDLGRKLLYKYEETDGYLVSRVVEEVNGVELRQVQFDYVDGELTSVTDVAGIESSFRYESSTDLSAVTSMTTPYGTTQFVKTSFTRELSSTKILYYTGLKITDPEGLSESLLYAPQVNEGFFSEYDEDSGHFGSGNIHGTHGSLSSSEDPFYQNGNARSTNLYRSVTLYWDKKASKYHPPNFETGENFDYSRLSVWMYGTDNSSGSSVYLTKPYLEASRAPGVGWTVRDYLNDNPGTSIPSNPIDFSPRAIGHVTQNASGVATPAVTEFDYTASGLLEAQTDPLGRRVSYVYGANGIDVEQVWVGDPTGGNPGEFQVSEMVYGGTVAHLPTETYDSANNKTTIVYNSKGQVTQITNALNEVYDFTYTWPTGFTDPTSGTGPADNDGFLQSIKVTDTTNGISAVEVLLVTYHANTGYVHTVTDSLTGLVTTYNSYDELGRNTKTTHPDGSSEEFFFEKDGVKYLDVMRHLNREGQSTHYTYNGNRQLVSSIDPELRNTRLEWCSCGHLEALIDALGRRTEWKRDLLGRVTDKILPDGKKTSYTYQLESGRLETITYPNQQGGANASVDLAYYIDGALAQKSYPGETNPFYAKYTYGALMGRMQSSQWYDESNTLQTTQHGYYPLSVSLGSGASGSLGAGMLHTIDGPWPKDTVSYTYDALNRQIETEIDANSTPLYKDEITLIDGLGRVKTRVNNISTFSIAYSGNDPRPDEVTTPGSNVDFKIDYDYFPANQGGYLKTIHNTFSGSTISKFDYTYAEDGKIETWKKEQNGSVKFMEFVHDLAGQLKQATTRQTNASGAILENLSFGYDRAGNRTSRTDGGDPFTANFNDRNQLTTGDFLGEVPLIGEMDEFAQVEVTANGQTKPARVRQSGSGWLFETSVKLENDGTTQVDVDATDQSDNTTSQSYRIDSSSGQWASLTYDDNGNTLTRSVTKNGTTTVTSYTWDRENRLETVTLGGVTDRFVYNAAGERVKIIEDVGGTSPNERRFIWTGRNHPSQERDSANVVKSHFFDEGEMQIGAGTWAYTRDHLGSIRELVNGAGVRARYDYSPYGIREELGTQNAEATFGFTGHLHHELTGHWLTFYRVYDSELGRWLSPDPIGEAGGNNLYAYVRNSPISFDDPLGLDINLKVPGGKEFSEANLTGLQNKEFEVHSHGNQNMIIDERSGTQVEILVDDLVDLILDPKNGYKPGEDVYLRSCYAGDGWKDHKGRPAKPGMFFYPKPNNIAQRLADALSKKLGKKINVYGASGVTQIRKRGAYRRYVVGDWIPGTENGITNVGTKGNKFVKHEGCLE